MDPSKYIDKMEETYERLFGEPPTDKVSSPLTKGDHPELDTSIFLEENDIEIYQSLIGSMQWAVSICFMLVVGASYKGPSHHTMYLRASLAYQFKYEYRLSAL